MAASSTSSTNQGASRGQAAGAQANPALDTQTAPSFVPIDDGVIVPRPVNNPFLGIGAFDDNLANEIFEFVRELNGQDAYNAQAVALGALAKAFYLRVPTGFEPRAFTPEHIGQITADPAGMRNIRLAADIYALNKAVCPDDAYKIKYGAVRLGLVQAGWYVDKHEVTQEAPPSDSLAIYGKDLNENREVFRDAKKLGAILPMVSEYVFRVMGHHFISGMADSYKTKYSNVLRACLIGNLAEFLPPEHLFHSVSHWVSPSIAYKVIQHASAVTRIPAAIHLRATAAPAGCAMISTGVTILEAIAPLGQLKELSSHVGVDLETIYRAWDMIKANPCKFHTAYFAYGVSGPTPDDIKLLEDAKRYTRLLAPVLQGYLDSLKANHNLRAARALEKYADTNPMIRTRAQRFFKQFSRRDMTDLLDVLHPSRTERATNHDADIDAED